MQDRDQRLELRHQDDRFADAFVWPLARGVFAGGIAVAALVVWAVNFEAFLNARENGGMALALIRMVICDAIPIAILFITYRWLSSGRNSEGLMHSIVGAIGLRPTPQLVDALDNDAGFKIEA